MFFFFKQKTAYEVRISDWSSDVCSSDLTGDRVGRAACRKRHDDGDGGRGVILGEGPGRNQRDRQDGKHKSHGPTSLSLPGTAFSPGLFLPRVGSVRQRRAKIL